MIVRPVFYLVFPIMAVVLSGCPGEGGTDCPDDYCAGQCVNLQMSPDNCGACGNRCPLDQRCEAGFCVNMCQYGLNYCSGVCMDVTSNPENCGACGNRCSGGQICDRGSCTGGGCPSGQSECGGVCVSLRSDATNCGACGVRCDGPCVNGECATTCPGETTECFGECVDLQKDETNCGSCGNICAEVETCESGRCGSNCDEGLTACGGSVCVDTRSDPANCNRCGNACAPGQLCLNSSCTDEGCPDGQDECGGVCVDTSSDRINCGSCGRTCPEGQGCSGGACELRCPDGQSNCREVCVDLNADRSNCGACDTSCRRDQVCTTGRCLCATGRTDCSGACVDTSEDPANCGSCGTTCTAPSACESGACTATCPPGTTPCGGHCVSTTSDRNNCGSCGHVCPEGQTCATGSCSSSGVVAGDTCTSPIDVSGGGRFTGTAASAGADYAGSCGGGRGRDIVFRYTLTATTDVYMNSFGSSYDTLMYVSSGCGGADEGNCNDDARDTFQSELILLDQPAGTYYVTLDSYLTTAGDYSFDIYFSAPSYYSGDACGDPKWFDITTTTVLDEYTSHWLWIDARPDTAACGRGAEGRDAVFYFVVSSRTNVTFATCGETSWDTILDLRRVCDDDSEGARVTCNDDGCGMQSSISATLDPGVYYLWIDGYEEDDCGSFQIQVTTS